MLSNTGTGLLFIRAQEARRTVTKNFTETTRAQATRQAVHLLGGVQRVRTRVRGFAPWSPEKATLALLDQVKGVLNEYAAHLPLTIRQIFYRLVGAHDYEKSERAYQRLIEHLNRARRARIISMDVIRDDGGIISEPNHWASAEQFMATVGAMAKSFTLDHSAGQKIRLIVICEAGGMVPQLERVAHPFGVTVLSGGGFDSLTDKHKSRPPWPVTTASPWCCISATTIRPASRCSWPFSKTSRHSPAISAATSPSPGLP